MKTRAKSALIMAPLLIIVFLGGYFLLAGVFMLSLLAIREYCDAFGDKKPVKWVLIASLCILTISYCLYLVIDSLGLTTVSLSDISLMHSIMLPWVFVSLILCFLSMFALEKRDLFQGMATITGIFYINFLAFHIVLIDNAYTIPISVGAFKFSGLNSYVWIVILAAFGTDIFAYLTGKAFGKHKLCPTISPKKTIEGSIGGIIGSVILCGLFGWLFIPDRFIDFIIIGIVGSIIAQLGDLTASVMKRKLDIKDWGTLIPGHGGVLDRVDSILFAAPFVYYFLLLKDLLILTI